MRGRNECRGRERTRDASTAWGWRAGRRLGGRETGGGWVVGWMSLGPRCLSRRRDGSCRRVGCAGSSVQRALGVLERGAFGCTRWNGGGEKSVARPRMSRHCCCCCGGAVGWWWWWWMVSTAVARAWGGRMKTVQERDRDDAWDGWRMEDGGWRMDGGGYSLWWMCWVLLVVVGGGHWVVGGCWVLVVSSSRHSMRGSVGGGEMLPLLTITSGVT